jgi:hypothetical protein
MHAASGDFKDVSHNGYFDAANRLAVQVVRNYPVTTPDRVGALICGKAARRMTQATNAESGKCPAIARMSGHFLYPKRWLFAGWRRLSRGSFSLRLFVCLMASDCTTCCGPQEAMLSGHMPCHTTYSRTFQTSFGTGKPGIGSKGSQQGQGDNSGFHGKSPFLLTDK